MLAHILGERIFNSGAKAVKTWHVLDPVPTQELISVDNVFQNFIEHVANVGLSGGERWPVMKYPVWILDCLILATFRIDQFLSLRATSKVLPVV